MKLVCPYKSLPFLEILIHDSTLDLKTLIPRPYSLMQKPEVYIFGGFFIFEHLNNEFLLILLPRKPQCYLPAIPHNILSYYFEILENPLGK